MFDKNFKHELFLNPRAIVILFFKSFKIFTFLRYDFSNNLKPILFSCGGTLLTYFIKDPAIKVTLQECWATPDQNPNDALQHFLIENGCGVEDVLDGTLKIYENGQSKMAKWAGSVFKFVGYDQVWLHCNIRVCFGGEDCVTKCGNRKKRDSGDDFELHTVSSSHPIRRVEQVIELDEISIETSDSNGI